MRELCWFFTTYVVATACYVVGLVLTGTVASAYAATLCLLALSVVAVRATLVAVVDRDTRERRTRLNGMVAVVAFVMFLGFAQYVPLVERTVSTWVGLAATIAVLLTILVGLWPYLTLLRSRLRASAYLAPAAGFILAFYFQPPLEGGGRALDLVLRLALWAFADATRGYLAGLTAILMATVVVAALIPVTEGRNWLATFLVKLALCLSAGATATYTIALVSWLNPDTLTTWHVVLGWVPLLFTLAVALLAATLYEPAYHALSFKQAGSVAAAILGQALLAGYLGSWFHALVLVIVGASTLVCLTYVSELVLPSPWGPQLKPDGPHLGRRVLERALIAWAVLHTVAALLYVMLWPHEGPWRVALVLLVALVTVALSIAALRRRAPALLPSA